MTDSSSDLQPQPLPSEPVATAPPSGHPTARTRISGAWLAVIVAALVLVLLLVFILQNTRPVKISYFTANGMMPLGVALLLAAIAGVLLAGVVASLRILQLRRRVNSPSAGRRLGRGRSASSSAMTESEPPSR